MMDDFLNAYEGEFIRLYRSFHQCAELSTLEYETGALIRGCLDQWQIPYRYPVADTGIVAVIEGKKQRKESPGENGQSSSPAPKVVALRADMDALPIYEDPHRPFCSRHPGIMHACGHDAHMAIALGAARYFKERESDFSGCVKIFFQPAEETIGGAERMVAEGCMEDPAVDYVLGLHLAPYLETGDIELKYGKLYASSDEIFLSVKGKSCHGAYPDTGTDAVVLAAQLICALQTIVSRQVSPLDQCVLSLGTIHGGSAHNILADTVDITGALRTTDPDTRQKVKASITRLTEALLSAQGGHGKVHFQPGYDALINTDSLVDLLFRAAVPILGREHVHFKQTPGMGVEDFSAFLKKAPGVFYHLGCGNQKKGLTAPLHSREFSPDEGCIALGIRQQAALAESLINS